MVMSYTDSVGHRWVFNLLVPSGVLSVVIVDNQLSEVDSQLVER
jgi:hypothetical protein